MAYCEESLGANKLPTEHTAKAVIRLGKCSELFQSRLCTNLFCWLCHVMAQIVMHIRPPEKQILGHKIVDNFLSLNLNICFGCSKEPSH